MYQLQRKKLPNRKDFLSKETILFFIKQKVVGSELIRRDHLKYF